LKYLNQKEGADVAFVLKANNNEKKIVIYGHKVILSTRCDYFSAIFSSGFKEAEEMKEKEIKLLRKSKEIWNNNNINNANSIVVGKEEEEKEKEKEEEEEAENNDLIQKIKIDLTSSPSISPSIANIFIKMLEFLYSGNEAFLRLYTDKEAQEEQEAQEKEEKAEKRKRRKRRKRKRKLKEN